MTHDSYKVALGAARSEKAALLDERVKIDERITQLDKIIESLSPLVEDQDSIVESKGHLLGLSELGLADACRTILQSDNRFMTPIVVRDKLLSVGYDLSKQSNALASIHAVLKRIADSGEAETTTVDGKTFYRWRKRTNILTEAVERAVTEAVNLTTRTINTLPPVRRPVNSANDGAKSSTTSTPIARPPQLPTGGIKIQPRNKTAMEIIKSKDKKE